MADPLAQILAGPILRRTDAAAVWVWLATSRAVDVAGSVYDAEASRAAGTGLQPLAAGSSKSRVFGAALHLTLVGMKPPSGSLPAGRLLAYDLAVTPAGGTPFSLRDNPELAGEDRISYPPYGLPTFFVPDTGKAVNLLHGSCRKPHGEDEDALAAVDALIGDHVADRAARPSALFLSGDQIYADDVDGALLTPVAELAGRLLGFAETTQIKATDPPVPVSSLKAGERGQRLARVFTPDDPLKIDKSSARNHLVGFGEFAAMHLLGWNRAVWAPKTGDTSPDVVAFRSSLPAVRRALANIPTYMMLDDHDVTDDWNRTKAWQARAEASPLGRRLIANALVAFWAFQAWGNDPAADPPPFATAATAAQKYFGGGGKDADQAAAYEQAALAFRDFSFVAPTHPKVVVVDMRTTRGPDAGDLVDGRPPDPDAPPEILGKAGLEAFVKLATAACKPGELLAVLAPAPVIGFAQWERPQEFLAESGLPGFSADEIDLESWHANPAAYHRLLVAIAERVRPGACLFLSGDVHFAHVAKAVLTPRVVPGAPPGQVGFTQFTSSALKHRHGGAKRFLLNVAGVFVPDLDPEWVWKPTPAGGSLPTVREARKAQLASVTAQHGAPDYTHRSYSLGATMCADTPLLVTGSNIGQLQMDDAKPATLARLRFLSPTATVVADRELHLDWRPALRPRDQ